VLKDINCPNCNATDHEEGAIFCHICGTKLRETDVVPIKIDELHRLRTGNARLEVILQNGFAPGGCHLVNDADYKALNDSTNRLNTILRQGYAPDGKVLISKTEYDELKKRSHQRGVYSAKWLSVVAVAVIAVLLFIVIRNTISNDNSSTERFIEETRVDYSEKTKNLSGNYIVRKMNGDNNSNASVKIYQEGNGYAMNVYSSNITRKYTFTYNSSTGEITSEELGSGRARIKGITNEIEITFEGWELLK